MGLFSRQPRKTFDTYVAYAEEANATLVDVRESNEYLSGHIEGAVSLPLSTLASRAETVLPDKSAELLVYCMGGGRAGKACSVLKSMGYTNTINIGGIKSFHGATVKGN